MSFDTAAVLALFAAIKSQAMESGMFDRVLGHEPKSAPGNRLSCTIWLGAVTPVPAASGLAATTGRVVINARIQTPFLQSNEDQVETNMTRAIVQMIAAYSSDLTVGGTVMEIDLLGAYGVALEASSVGYIEQDGTHYRAAELTIPVIIDALWTQED